MKSVPWSDLCKPSALRAQVSLRRRTKTPNGAGGYVESWNNTIAIVRAAIWLPTGGQVKLGASNEAVKSGVIVVRSRTDFTAPMRVVWGSRVFDAEVAVIPEENRARNYAALNVVERVT